jgi:NADPH:quinone reductase-like Zn-dependent oxidoreductase
MRAAMMTKYGGDDAVTVRETEEPRPGDGDVLVEVRAASVNPVDLKIRNGKMKPVVGYRFPQILGEDVSGVVVAVGNGVTDVTVGDEVMGCLPLSKMGAFAERVALPAGDVAPKPKHMTHEEAACLPLVAMTACQAFDRAGLTAGQRVFVRVGSGGSGVAAIQVAKALGAEVTTTAGTRNLEWVRALVADRVVDYQKEGLEGLGDFDVVLENSPTPTMLESFRLARTGGQVISIADLPDAAFAKEWGLNVFFHWAFAFVGRKATREAKRRGVHYTFFIMRPNGTQLRQVARWAEERKLRGVIDTTFPLARTRDALAHVAGGRTKGKVIITMT